MSLKEEQKEAPRQLSKTYLKTLDLIEENHDIYSISKIRELQLSSVLVHINVLNENDKISDEIKVSLFSQVMIPNEIKNWCEESMVLGDIKQLRQYLYIYDLTYNVSK